jgi:hypothetical protein
MGDDINMNIKETGWEGVDCNDVLRIGTCSVLGFCKLGRISGLVEELVACQEGFYSELFS